VPGSSADAAKGSAAAAVSTEGILPGDLTERRWRRFLGFFDRQLSSGPLLRHKPNTHASSHTRKEWVAKSRDGKRVEHVKVRNTNSNNRIKRSCLCAM
jgi:hypothetical protein